MAVMSREVELSVYPQEEQQRPAGREGGIYTLEETGGGLSVRDMTVQTPTGRTLVECLSLALDSPGSLAGAGPAARRLLVVGPSGFGKSSVLRAVAGLWTRGAGLVRRPPAGEMLFLPQKPYMPLGDLRMQLLYPNVLADRTDDEMCKALASLGLGDLPSRFSGGFDALQDWARVLSVGEQQRLAAARCLLSTPSPAILVLDEATSALPVGDEARLYKLFCDRGLSYISVGHRESLLEFHDMVLEICGAGTWKLMHPQEYKRLSLHQQQEGSGASISSIHNVRSPGAIRTDERESTLESPQQLRCRERTPDSGQLL